MMREGCRHEDAPHDCEDEDFMCHRCACDKGPSLVNEWRREHPFRYLWESFKLEVGEWRWKRFPRVSRFIYELRGGDER